MIQRILGAVALSSLALASVSAAAAAAEVRVEESAKYGAYLTDGQGRALYLFTTDSRGKGDARAEISCTSDACLQAWPPLYADGKPEAGKGADAGKLDTVDFRGRNVVTYNGWPLYYFVKDTGPGSAHGQDIHSFGGGWYLLTPAGTKLEKAEAARK